MTGDADRSNRFRRGFSLVECSNLLVPRSDGGLNHISNRALLCGPCNRLKSNIYTLSGLRKQNKQLGYMSEDLL